MGIRTLIPATPADKAQQLGPRWPTSSDLAASLPWAFVIGVVFFSVYPLCNRLAAQSADLWRVHLEWELSIPFVPQFVWLYLSMYLLFILPPAFVPSARFRALALQLIGGSLIGGVFFLLLPAELGFPRTLPAEAPYDRIFAAIYGIDRPHNLVPSLHVVFTAMIALACADFARPWARVALWIWLIGVIVSTVLVHQHHVVDVLAALTLVAVLRRIWPLRRVTTTVIAPAVA